MTSVRVQYLRLMLRKWMQYMRRRLLTIFFLCLAAGLVLAACYRRLSEQKSPAVAHVALVIPGEQEEIRQMAGLLKYMDSVRSTIDFVYPEEDELDGLFASGEIQAAILFYEDFYNDVNDGVNTPVCIRLAAAYESSELFKELLEDMVLLVDVTEAASYAMIDAYRVHPAEMSLKDMQDMIMRDNVELLFDIRSRISAQILSPTGTVSLLEYYASLAFLLFLLAIGLGFWSLYDPGCRLAEEKLKVYGAGRVFQSVCKLAVMTAAEFACALIAFGLCVCLNRYFLDLPVVCDRAALGGLLFVSAAYACFYHGVLMLARSGRERKRILLLVLALFLLLGGCIVPSVYLPQAVKPFVAWTPFAQYRSCLTAALFGGNISWAALAVWSLIFLAAGEFAYGQIGSRQADAHAYEMAKARVKCAAGGGFSSCCLRALLYIKWQVRRITPLVVLACVLLLAALAAGIRFPQAMERTILLSGEEEMCRDIKEHPLLNRTYRFVYEKDSAVCEEAVKSGRALAWADLAEDEIPFYAVAASPDVLVARETVAAACYQYRQKALLLRECETVFGGEEVYIEVQKSFDQYMQSDELFHVYYHME